jgi:hypothetical protein
MPWHGIRSNIRQVTDSLRRFWLLLLLPGTLGAATFAVTTTAASGPGSLTQAILDANATAGINTIAFNIPGTGVQTITGGLPTITGSVIIDGYSQPGASPNTAAVGNNAVLLIELSGGTLTLLRGSNPTASTIQGLVINHGGGISIQGSGFTGGNSIWGNFIGTSADGLSGADGGGIYVRNHGNWIAGNVISGNGTAISLQSAKSNYISGNLIGTNAPGTAAIPNGVGISISKVTMENPTTNTITSNVISGNSSKAISASDIGGSGISYNSIGVDVLGQPLGNGAGVFISHIASAIFPWQSVNNNTIAYNNGDGVNVSDQFQDLVSISTNSIHDNAGLGIRISTSPAPGPPTLLTAASSGGSTTVTGSAPAAGNLELFSNATCDPSGAGEGETPLGMFNLQAGGFSVQVPWVPGDRVITATLSSSQFSPCIAVTVIGPSPTPTITPTPTATSTPAATWTPTFLTPTPTPAPPTPTPTPGFDVAAIAPRSGAAAGGTSVTVAGTGFLPGASLTIGGVMAENVVVIGSEQIDATAPPLSPGTLNDVAVTNGAPGRPGPRARLATAVLSSGWMADFLDVPQDDSFHSAVEQIFRAAITAGCGGGLYCRDAAVHRDQMAAFLLKAEHGAAYLPPDCAGIFTDVPCSNPFAQWIEQLAAEGITGGCGDGIYCPDSPVRRDQMAVFLLKAEHGPDYVPPGCLNAFPDVACPSTFADWIEQLAAEGITGGCGGGNFCPGSSSTRGQMAVFLAKTFLQQ